MALKKAAKLYTKWIVKNPTVFFVFILIWISWLLFMLYNVKIDCLSTFDGNINILHDNQYEISFKSDKLNNPEMIYIYNNRNEQIYDFEVESLSLSNGEYKISIFSKAPLVTELVNPVKVDIPQGEITLLERLIRG